MGGIYHVRRPESLADLRRANSQEDPWTIQFWGVGNENWGCEFLDTAEVIVSSKLDAIHLDAEEHRKLGQAVAARVREIFEA